jgi:diguanylate cyclase (GGDEF)-like protein
VITGNEQVLLEALEKIQQTFLVTSNHLQDSKSFNDMQSALTQALNFYGQLHDLHQEITHCQKQLNEATQQASQVRNLFLEAFNIITFNLSQINEAQLVSSQSQQDLVHLRESLHQLEMTIHQLMVGDTLSPQPVQGVGKVTTNFEHIVDRMVMANRARAAGEQRSGKCLIIDQNPNTAESAQRRLAHEGYEVFTVSDADAGYKIITKNAIDVVLIDIQSSEGDYAALIADIIKRETFGYIPVLVMGTLNQLDRMSRMLEKGAEEFLIKPLNSTLLKSRVSSSLEKKDAYELRRERMEESQHLREELQQAIAELTDGFISFDQNRKLLLYNNKIFDIFPYLKELAPRLIGMSIETWLQSILETGIINFSHYSEAELECAQEKWLSERLEILSSPAIVWREQLITGQALQITSYRTAEGDTVIILKDDTEDHARHEQLAYLAYHDVLTGLGNRGLFYNRLKQAINLSTSKAHGIAVMFMDLDRFKAINDENGHDVGDWLLVQVAQRLRHCIRDRDVIVRFGGDEFAAIIHDISNPDAVKPLLERIVAVISSPFHYKGIDLWVGISVGVSLYPHHSHEFGTLLSQADAAMYTAKQSGRSTYRFYIPSMKQGVTRFIEAKVS